MTANALSTVGLMLTLAGLVGSFFNIQLSQWLRDLVALDQKVKLNKAEGTADQLKAMVECRIEFEKLSNVQTYTINLLVLAFVLFVLGDGLLMIRAACSDPAYPYVNVALWVFLVFFLGVSGWLIASASAIARRVEGILKPKAQT